MSVVYLNGELLPEDEAGISVRDRGFLLGDSVFETMAVYNGQVFLLDEHLARLEHSAERVYLQLPLPRDAFLAAVNRTIAANRLSHGTLRLTVTRGVGPPGIDPLAETDPTVVITAGPARDYSTERQEGVDVVVSSVRRNAPDAVPLDAKTGSFLSNILARRDASEAGAFEALMLSQDGTVAEGTISNVFALIGGVVRTPPLDGRILPGVTRAAVLCLCAGLEVDAREESLAPTDLRRANEVWLTNSLIEIVPVRSLDGRQIPGLWPMCARVQAAYTEWVERECGPTPPSP